MMPVIYVGHKFGGDRLNIMMARTHLHELTRRFPGVLWVAPWLDWARALVDDREAQRDRGLAMDLAFIRRCGDAGLFVGETSDGQESEQNELALWGRPSRVVPAEWSSDPYWCQQIEVFADEVKRRVARQSMGYLVTAGPFDDYHYVIDPVDGISFHDGEQDARQAASDYLASHADAAGHSGWHECIDDLEWGRVSLHPIQRVSEVDRRNASPSGIRGRYISSVARVGGVNKLRVIHRGRRR